MNRTERSVDLERAGKMKNVSVHRNCQSFSLRRKSNSSNTGKVVAVEGMRGQRSGQKDGWQAEVAADVDLPQGSLSADGHWWRPTFAALTTPPRGQECKDFAKAGWSP